MFTGGLDTQGPADEDQRQASDDLRGILRQGEFEYRLYMRRIQPKIIEKGYRQCCGTGTVTVETVTSCDSRTGTGNLIKGFSGTETGTRTFGYLLGRQTSSFGGGGGKLIFVTILSA